MPAISPPVGLPFMARKARPANAETDQANFRLKRTTLERMERYSDAHPLRPSLTQIVEAAVLEWLDKHQKELPDGWAKRHKPS